jgi:hypothetical protein
MLLLLIGGRNELQLSDRMMVKEDLALFVERKAGAG